MHQTIGKYVCICLMDHSHLQFIMGTEPILELFDSSCNSSCNRRCELEYYPYDKYKSPHMGTPISNMGGGGTLE